MSKPHPAVVAVAKAIREAESRYVIGHEKGSNEWWTLIDRSTADPDVNWPGEWLGETRTVDDLPQLVEQLNALVANAAIRAFLDATREPSASQLNDAKDAIWCDPELEDRHMLIALHDQLRRKVLGDLSGEAQGTKSDE